MQDSWRITINDIDRSKVAKPASREIGAMVVNASRGPNQPMFFDRGASTDILDAFGPIYDDTTEYPELLEALEFNSYSPIFLSSFYEAGEVAPDKLGGVVVNPDGVTALTSGKSLTPAEMAEGDYTQFTPKAAEIGNPDYELGVSEDDITKFPYGIDADDIAAVIALGADTAVPYTGPSGTAYDNGILLTDATKFPNGLDAADYPTSGGIPPHQDATKADYFLLTTKSPHKDGGSAFGVSVSMTNTEETKANPTFTISVYKKLTDGSWKKMETFSDCSLNPSSLDKYKNSNYILVRMASSKYVDVLLNPDLAYEDLVVARWPAAYEAPTVALAGSTRTAIENEDSQTYRTACWQAFQKKSKYPVDIFMDASGLAGMATVFKALGQTYQKYAMYLLALPVDLAEEELSVAAAGYSGLNFPNGVAYWNAGYLSTFYYGGTRSMLTTLIGRVGIKYAQMQTVFDAMPPCMFDENGYGGQLDNVGNAGKVLQMAFDPSDALQKAMNNDYGINPIIWDPVDGTMIGGQKTMQDPTYHSDTSYVCHVRVFNYIKKNALNKVFTRQATKYNDDTHQFTVKSGLEAIVAPLVSRKFLAQAKVVCGSSNNNIPEVRAQRQFVASMAVRVTPTSEEVIFNFINVDQSTDVNTVI